MKKNNSKKPAVIGHRGAKFHALENTINAIKKAIVLKADMIELDIRLTKDNIPVHIHNRKINKTTDGKGRVSKLTLKEIKKFNSNGEKIPTLNQVLRSFKDQKFLFDIKEFKAILPTLKVIYKNNAEDRVVIGSRIAKGLKLVKHFNPQIKTAIIYRFPIRNNIKLAKRFGIEVIQPHYFFATKRIIKKAHENNLKVNVWTVNNKDRIQKLIENGVDSIITDNPSLIRGVKNG
ncbi:glycerophosphodiester phosphodiesterase [Candidatus Woesearchaeota archaeon]|nr:glycerophosphodiester phosphodiesterase [Candidatus Woesearchaeota archaeon]